MTFKSLSPTVICLRNWIQVLSWIFESPCLCLSSFCRPIRFFLWAWVPGQRISLRGIWFYVWQILPTFKVRNSARGSIANTLHETNIAPENGWLEDDPFLLGWPIFRCELSVSGRVSQLSVSCFLKTNLQLFQSIFLLGYLLQQESCRTGLSNISPYSP